VEDNEYSLHVYMPYELMQSYYNTESGTYERNCCIILLAKSTRGRLVYSQSHIATDGQSVSMSWCRAQIWDF
jgi:hypothetical protein